MKSLQQKTILRQLYYPHVSDKGDVLGPHDFDALGVRCSVFLFKHCFGWRYFLSRSLHSFDELECKC